MQAQDKTHPHHPPATNHPASPRRIAMMNQKGGVGKTTTAVNLAAALALKNQRVLMIDLDPQAHLTLHLGINPEELDISVHHVLTQPQTSALQAIQEITDNLWLLPAETNLAGVENELAQLAHQGTAQQILKEKIHPILLNPNPPHQPLFDFLMIDCPPSLGLLTINALALANEVMVPMQAHFLALQGLSKLLSTITMVRQGINPSLQVTAVIVGLYDGQTALAREVMQDLKNFLLAAQSMNVPWQHAQVLDPPIRRNIKLAESPSFGKTIFDYAPLCPGASDFRQLADNVLQMTLHP